MQEVLANMEPEPGLTSAMAVDLLYSLTYLIIQTTGCGAHIHTTSITAFLFFEVSQSAPIRQSVICQLLLETSM